MADITQLEGALRRAHAAGDTKAAARFASEIANLRAQNFSGTDSPKEDNFFVKLANGATVAGRKGLMGIENMLPDSAEKYINMISPEHRDTKEKRLQNIKEGESYINQAGGVAKGGEVAAQVGAELVPVLKGAKMLQHATQAWGPVKGAVTRLLGNAAVAGGTTGVLSMDDKVNDASQSALASAAIDATLGTAGRVIRGVAPGITAEARNLMDRGVHVPFWKATSNDTVRNLAERMKAMPMTGPAMRQQEQAALSDYTAMKAKEAMPEYLPSYDSDGVFKSWVKNNKNVDVNDTMLDTIKHQNDQVFDEIYRGRTIPMKGSGYDLPADVSALLNDVKTTKPDIANLVEGRINGIQNPMTQAVTLNSTPQFSPILNTRGNPIQTGVNQSGGNAGISADTLKDHINKASTQAVDLQRSGQTEAAQYMHDYANLLKDMRLKGLPPDASDMLPMANDAWRNMMILENAYGKGGANRAGVLSPRNISDSLRAMDRSPNKRVFAHNNMPGQRTVNQDNQVLGSLLPDVGPGTAEKMQAMMFTALGPAASIGLMGQDLGALSLLTTKLGNKILMGSTKPQVNAARWLDRNQPALSAVLRAGSGATILNQE